MSDAAAKRRARQTVINLLLSLAATLGLVLVLILAVPRDDSNRLQPVDYQDIANEAANQAPGELLVPTFPVDWYSNSARYRTAAQDGVANWYIGFVGPNSEYIAMTQGIDVNETWLQFQLESAKPTGERQIGGAKWMVFENPSPSNPPKSKDFVMLREYGNNAVLIYGVANQYQFDDFARQLNTLISETQ